MPKEALRVSHVGITLNDRSSRMEVRLRAALVDVVRRIGHMFGVAVESEDTLPLDTIVSHLNATFGPPNGLAFGKATANPRSSLKPDGDFLYVRDQSDVKRCILVTEVKRQGTNTDRVAEGKPRQAQGNAIGRLRKNMQGVDAFFAGEAITPFVCFGEGCDFADGVTILDRVSTMNGFFPLNVVHVDKIYVDKPAPEIFKPTSLFFREEPWSSQEMRDVIWRICQRSIAYYQDTYGPLRLARAEPKIVSEGDHDFPIVASDGR